jgi:copper(I)-binding protein
VALAPGALHIMLMGLKHPLVAGSAVALDLTFTHAGVVHVRVPVQPIGASGPPG